MTKLTNFFIFFIFLFGFGSSSQMFSSVQVLIKGKITDELNHKPIGVNIEFRDNNGKKIKCQSNSLSGEFEQVLESGQKFKVILSSDVILRKEFKFSVIDTNQYAEQKTDWLVIKPVIDAIVFQGSVFNDNDSNISRAGTESLEELQMLLRFNRTLHVVFKIYTEEIITIKGKKKTTSINLELLDKRVKAIEQIISSWTMENPRIQIKQIDNSVEQYNLVVQITKLQSYVE
jgi:hypothetical protein